MSANIRLKNWQQYAQSNFTWLAELYYPTAEQAWKLLFGYLPMTGTWSVPFAAGDPGYSSYVNCFIRVHFYNQFGAQVTDLGKWPCWLINGKTYEFDCVSHVLAELSTGPSAHIIGKQLRYGSSTMTDIPVSASVALNDQGYIGVAAQNDSVDPRLLSMSVTVKRPDSSTAFTISGDQSSYVDPGAGNLFGGFSGYGPFTFDQAGGWTITITLAIWDGSQWLLADSWQGDLCTVAQGTGLTAPALISPADGATVQGTSINFQWNAVPGAVGYVLRIDKAGVQFVAQAVYGLSQYVSNFVNDGATYTWKVLAFINILNNYGPWSVTRTFTNGVAPSVFSNFAVTYAKL